MGAVFRPKDLDRGKRSVINNAIKDFAPDTNIMLANCLIPGKEKNQKID
jgi:hypothetical protein